MLLSIPLHCRRFRHPHGKFASCVLSHCGFAILLAFVTSPILCLPTYFVFHIIEIWADNRTLVYAVNPRKDSTCYRSVVVHPHFHIIIITTASAHHRHYVFGCGECTTLSIIHKPYRNAARLEVPPRAAWSSCRVRKYKRTTLYGRPPRMANCAIGATHTRTHMDASSKADFRCIYPLSIGIIKYNFDT